MPNNHNKIKVNYIKLDNISTPEEDTKLLAELFVLYAEGIEDVVKKGKIKLKNK